MFMIPATLLQTDTESFQLAASPAATPTAATFAVRLGADAFVKVPPAGFAALGSIGQVSFEALTADGLSVIRVDHTTRSARPRFGP